MVLKRASAYIEVLEPIRPTVSSQQRTPAAYAMASTPRRVLHTSITNCVIFGKKECISLSATQESSRYLRYLCLIYLSCLKPRTPRLSNSGSAWSFNLPHDGFPRTFLRLTQVDKSALSSIAVIFIFVIHQFVYIVILAIHTHFQFRHQFRHHIKSCRNQRSSSCLPPTTRWAALVTPLAGTWYVAPIVV